MQILYLIFYRLELIHRNGFANTYHGLKMSWSDLSSYQTVGLFYSMPSRTAFLVCEHSLVISFPNLTSCPLMHKPQPHAQTYRHLGIQISFDSTNKTDMVQ